MKKFSIFRRNSDSLEFHDAYVNITNIIDSREVNMSKIKSIDVFDEFLENLNILKKYDKCDTIKDLVKYSTDKKKPFYANYISDFYKKNCESSNSV